MNSSHSRLQAIETFFLQVSDIVGFAQVTPTKYSQVEGELRKRIFNPKFEYNPKREEIEFCVAILSHMNLGDSAFERLLEKTRRELIIKCQMMLSLGSDQFTKWSIRLYGKPTASLVKKAYAILEKPYTKEPIEFMPSLDAQKRLKEFFKQMNLPKWKIIKGNIAASAFVSTLNRELVLKKKSRFSKKFIERLCIHEIGTHATRAENGLLHPYLMLASGTAHYLETEEGLAVYNEELSGCLSQSVLRTYAGRVIAINYALSHSFVETYKHLRTFFSKKVAITLTLRAKRGMGDTSQSGACTKDILYLRGYFRVKQFAKKNNVRDLYLGKIGIDDLALLKEMKLAQPKYLPEHLK